VEALFPNLAKPLRIHRACVRAALAADDDPIDAAEVDPSERREQRLDAQKADAGVDLSPTSPARRPAPSTTGRPRTLTASGAWAATVPNMLG
jgi:hypothetical protein